MPGQDGANCKMDFDYYTGNMLVRHSQSSSIPLCDEDEITLWTGYSLLYLEGNEKSHHQDLGNPLTGSSIDILPCDFTDSMLLLEL